MLGHIVLVLIMGFSAYSWWETRKKNRESEGKSRRIEYLYLLLILFCIVLLVDRLLN